MDPFQLLAEGSFERGLELLNRCSSWQDFDESLDGPFFLGFPGKSGWGEALLLASLLKRHADHTSKRICVHAAPAVCSILQQDSAFRPCSLDELDAWRPSGGVRSPMAILREALSGNLLELPFKSIENKVGRNSVGGRPFRVGIAWSSVEGQDPQDRKPILGKFLPIKDFIEILENIEGEVVSFQRSYPDIERDYSVLRERFDCFQIAPTQDGSGDDQTEVVKEMTNLDCLVTISTTTTHIAACLGVPVILLAADRGGRQWFWRAQQEHRKLVYPTVEIFLGDGSKPWWRKCANRARASLENRVARHLIGRSS
ncbi:hypothetical protein [Caballeronia sp. NCTM5]|uniref:hypothetical protein n=1 Tax=Caballeronia sp. NCTM5 TaxID=2921755 RepID=UPI00202836F7|nr:hypothetical protein [Caballeronia sp. NCTM5]